MSAMDLVKLRVKAGDGGHGRVSFRREKFIPKGGPDGGNGGAGGSVWVKAVAGLNTLQHLTGVKQIVAQSGEMGGKRQKSGAAADDVVIEVPVGTVIWLLDENQASRHRRLQQPAEGRRWQPHFLRYTVEKAGEPVVPLPPDTLAPGAMQPLNPSKFKSLEKEQLVELSEPDQTFLLCQGGKGGRGSEAFKAPNNTTPLEAEYGQTGEEKSIVFELKLIADVGLVGLPNAGKSTLLSVLSAARPKIAEYAFTTLSPNLGVVSLADDASLVMADIPGIVEQAHQGKGLGLDFLRHVERCRALIYVLWQLPEDASTEADWWQQLQNQLQTVVAEVVTYDSRLAQLPSLVVLSKSDLLSDSALAWAQDHWSELFTASTQAAWLNPQQPLMFSAATHHNLDSLKRWLQDLAAVAE